MFRSNISNITIILNQYDNVVLSFFLRISKNFVYSNDIEHRVIIHTKLLFSIKKNNSKNTIFL